MIKNITKFEIQIADKMYHFLCEANASVSEAKEALFQFQKMVGQIEDALKSQQSQPPQGASPPSEAPVEETKEN